MGVCGEHGGEPTSIGLFYDAGLDYVSCSPYRVPVARLAAAQAVLASAPQSAEQSPTTPATATSKGKAKPPKKGKG